MTAEWTVEQTMDEWWSLTKDGHRPGWASVEGDADEWLSIAYAIEAGGSVRHKRCAASTDDTGTKLWSPRNAIGKGDVHLLSPVEAVHLAKNIRRTIAGTCREMTNPS